MTAKPKGKLAIDIYDQDDKLVIVAPIAGIKTKDLNIKAEGNSLIIEGHRDHIEKLSNEVDFLFKECFWGNFERKIILPNNLNTDKIEANFKSGILTIEIPKLTN